MAQLSTQDLQQLIDQYPILNSLTCKIHDGVHGADEIFNHVYMYPSAIISNTEERRKSGQHWVCYFIRSPFSCEYFDSFGEKAPALIEDFLSRFKTVKRSWDQAQSDFSETCGLYCVYFLLLRSQGYSFEQIMKTFDLNDHGRNEEKLIRYFRDKDI